MRYEEIHAHVQKLLREDLARRIEELKEKGPRATYTPSAFEGARTVLAKGPDAQWEHVGADVVKSQLERFAQRS